MSSDKKIQSLYNDLFDHIEQNRYKMTWSTILGHYWYHFIYSVGIAAWIDFPRAQKYKETVDRYTRYQESFSA